MSNQEPSNLDLYLPSPWPAFRRFLLFFHILTLVGLGVAFSLVVYQAWGNWGWQDSVVTLALMGQAALYLGCLVFYRCYPWPKWLLPFYFSLSLLLWLVEMLLAPGLFWLGFTYVGQMYGLLSLAPAIVGTIVIFLVIFVVNSGFSLQGMSYPAMFGWLSAWLSMIVLLSYLNHLMRTNRERGRLIDELKRAQEALQAAQQKEAELAVLRERERLARDMHDTLGHNLVALAVQLEAVQRLYRVDPEAASAVMDELKRLTRGSMDELRRTLAGLRAPGLGGRTLIEAVQALCVDFSQRNKVQVNCSWDDSTTSGAGSLPAPLAEVLWRAAQEALTNVEKHAGASQVNVRLSMPADAVRLLVEDDGCGFTPQAAPQPGHFGLAGMRERVEGVGGTLAIASTPGRGTRLEVHIPTLERVH